MATYIILINYTDQGIRTIKDSPKRIDAVKKALKGMGADMKSFHLTMGSYDAVAVIEAPNDETLAKFLLSVGAQGNVRTNTLKAFDEAGFRKIVKALP